MTENALVPQNDANEVVSQFGTMSGFDLLQRQAKMLASSSLVPEQFSFFDKNGKMKDQQAQAYAVANSVIALEISHQIPVYRKDIDEWLETKLKVCRQWSVDNPSRRKTRKGIRKHISGWLARDQDRKGRDSGGVKPAPDKRDCSLCA